MILERNNKEATMKGKLVAVVMLAGVVGCATPILNGITKQSVVDGVDMALAKHGLAGLVSKEQTAEIVDICVADLRLQAIGQQVVANAAANQELTERIEYLLGRYLPGGIPTDPSTNAPAAAAAAPAPVVPAGDPTITVTPGRQ